MNLNNLKTYVPAKLYKRGLDYFNQDFVEQLAEVALNRWNAIVTGTRDYEVTVKLKGDGTIVSSYCTCPFESDSLCKHEVAVCLAIRDYKEENRSPGEDVLTELKTLKKAELLDYCRTEVSAIEQLHPHLLADYPHEVNEIYTNHIYRQIERASNRKAYWTACQKIKDFKKVLGADPAAVLIEELKFMYPKRTAFLDELGKIE